MWRRASRLVVGMPEKVTQGWELARKQRAMLIEFFGSDLIVVPGPEVASRMVGFQNWYNAGCLRKPTRRQAASALTSLLGHRRSACRATLPVRLPLHWPMTKGKG